MQTLDEMEKHLHAKRRQCGWYGISRDYAMRRQLADECYELFVEIEYLKRAARALIKERGVLAPDISSLFPATG